MSSSGAGKKSEDKPSSLRDWISWIRNTDNVFVVYAKDFTISIFIVLFIGFILFAISGLWPPMVAVESPSMEPNMVRGDLVFLIDNERFTPESAPHHGGYSTGVVPSDVAQLNSQTSFGAYGDVIVFEPNGNEHRTPIIHRAELWVEEGENWYARADSQFIGTADNCSDLTDCPAPHSGFITKGDNNPAYDQVGDSQISTIVHPDWVIGTAEFRIPYLGNIRLWFSGATIQPVIETDDQMSVQAETLVSSTNHCDWLR